MNKTLESLLHKTKVFGTAATLGLVFNMSSPQIQGTAYSSKAQGTQEYVTQEDREIDLRGYVTNGSEDGIEGANVNVRYADLDTTLTTNYAGEWDLKKTVTSAENPGEVPNRYSLSSNYPNPFNPRTNVVYTTPERGPHIITIHNILGQELYKETKDLNQGDNSFSIGGVTVPGVYFFSGHNTSDPKSRLTEKMTSIGGGRENNISVSHSTGSSANFVNNNRIDKRQVGTTNSEDEVYVSITAEHYTPWTTTFTFESSPDQINTVLEKKVYGYLEGAVISNETLEGEKSTMRIYDPEWNQLKIKDADSEENYITNDNGEFKIKIIEKEDLSDLEMIIVQAAHGTPDNRTGYVRTETIPSKLVSPESPEYNPEFEFVSVPFKPYGDNPEEYNAHVKEWEGLNPNKADIDNRYFNKLKPELSGDEKFVILDKDPCDDSATIDREKQENIEEIILSPEHVNKLRTPSPIEENQILIGDAEDEHYTVNCSSFEPEYNISPNPGVYVVSPRSDFGVGGRAGLAVQSKSGTLVRGGVIYLSPNTGDWTTTHEFWHMFVGSPHPENLADETIGSTKGNRSTAGPADEKSGKMLYYELGYDDGRWSQFIRFDGLRYPRFDEVDNILGLEFGPDGKESHQNGFYWQSDF
ncbi:MAG: T9SS type A sorting domain-containing protein [Candidatus Pacearchaeota archaeon]